MIKPRFYVGQQVVATVGEESAIYSIVSGSFAGNEWSYYVKQDDEVTVSVSESDISYYLNYEHKWHSTPKSDGQRISI